MANYNLDEFKEYTLFPTLYEKIGSIFGMNGEGMDFQPKGNRWETNHHISNFLKDNEGKTSTYIYANNKGYIIEQGKSSESLIDFYGRYKGLSSFPEALEGLCSECGLTPPYYDREEYKQIRALQDSREIALKTFTTSLWNGSKEAQEVLDYLDSRSWTEEEIKAKRFGLVTTEIIETLQDRYEYSSSLKDKKGNKIGSIGTTHTLAIPYWNGSRLLGFKVREPREKLLTTDKYLNTCNLSKSIGLFGIGIGIKDVTIVEGELDALLAQVRGYESIAATAGGSAKASQLKDAINRGAKRITLLFDNDKAGRSYTLMEDENQQEKGTIPTAESLGIETYVALLPQEYKDVAEYLEAGHTTEELSKIAREAIPSFMYRYQTLLEKFAQIEEETGTITYKNRQDFFNKVEKIINAPNMKPYDRELIFKELEKQNDSLLLGMDGYREYLNNSWALSQEKKRKEYVDKILQDLIALNQKGETDKMLRLMNETSEQGRTINKATEFAKVFAPKSYNEYQRILSELQTGLPTGYGFPYGENRIESLTLNIGLTFVCGCRGHGKTTFLNNVAINEAIRQYHIKKNGGKWKRVLYFSYEIDERRLIANFLNVYSHDLNISSDPLATIYGYYSKGKTSKEKARYFKGQQQGEAFQKFEARQRTLLKELLGEGILTIVDTPYKLEDLLDGIKFYLSSIGNVSLICIDYAQQIYLEMAKNLQRTEEIKKIVNCIKDFANKEQLPFLLAAQFNRDIDSPAGIDTRSIGEGGDFERIADTCIGLYALKELHTPKENYERKVLLMILEKQRTLLPGLPLKDDLKKDIPALQGKLFVRLMKRRYGKAPLETILDWDEDTGYIKQNDLEHFKADPKEADLFSELEETQEEIDIPF